MITFVFTFYPKPDYPGKMDCESIGVNTQCQLALTHLVPCSTPKLHWSTERVVGFRRLA
jgi:hypothetical protein